MKALLAGLFAAAILAFGAEAAHVPDPDPEQGDGRVSAFYTWTGEIPSTPGQMLRTEPLEKKLGPNNAGQQTRILYSSIDGDGKTPIVVSGEFFGPKGAPPADGWPLLAWAHGTTGVADICAPSWQPHFVPENNYLNAWLAHGFAIVATDYQGLVVNSAPTIAAPSSDLVPNPITSEWFKGLRQPGTSLPCCSVSDCRRVDYRIADDGRYEVIIDETWYGVPNSFVLRHEGNPFGRAVACYTTISGYGTLLGNGAYDGDRIEILCFCAGATHLITAAA